VAAHALLVSAVMSLVALAVSSLCRSARVAGLGFVGLLTGLEIARGVVRGMFRAPEASLLSPQASLAAVCNALFGMKDRLVDVPWPYALGVLVAVGASCLLVLRSRVRAVEIVQ
jgi:hypothetical protein